MNDRTPLWLVLIGLLTSAAVYVNLDLVKQSFSPADAVKRWVTWQGENFDQRLTLREGLDLQGGLQVLLQADQSKDELQPGDLDGAMTVIENRVNSLGVTEPNVQTQGADKIVVELPGVQDPELAIRTIGQTALLEFVQAAKQRLNAGDVVSTTFPLLYEKLPKDKQKEPFLGDPNDPLGTGKASAAAKAGAAGATATRDVGAKTPATGTASVAASGTGGQATAGATVAASDTATPSGGAAGGKAASTGPGTKPELKLLYPTIFTGEDVEQASVGFDPAKGVVVSFQLKTSGGGRMQEYTNEHVGDIMPILLDKKVLSAPEIRGKIGAQGQIEGRFSEEEAQSLVAQINSGSLPVPLKVVGQTRVGPTLGGEAVKAAILGGLIGLAAVMVFMLLYYRMPGLLANLALVLYALFSLMIFRLFPVTLTLAGIAGFVLSIGMAVDANILIFERMKEELRGGRRIGAAMDIGFSRAWPSIRDSNFSTIITCLVLLWFGSQFGASVVKGFAVTLMIGVATSMFTAIVVTRTFLKVANRLILHETDLPTLEDRRLRALFGF